MKVHLIKTLDFPNSEYDEIAALLGNLPGPIDFIFYDAELPFKRSNLVPKESETDIFDQYYSYYPGICNSFRELNDLDREDIIFLLTSFNPEIGWFLGSDLQNSRNIFVHPDYSDPFIGSERKYLAAYYIAVCPLLLERFETFEAIMENAHSTPIGCIMDHSQTIEHLRMKLRTGDICSNCMEHIQNNGINPLLVSQVLQAMYRIKQKMEYQSSRRLFMTPSRLHINYRKKTLSFLDFGNLELSLAPLEMTVYALHLNHPKGLSRVEFSEKKEELYEIYRRLSTKGDVSADRQAIDTLTDLRTNSYSERISKINRILKKNLGAEFSKYYTISGKNGNKRKILLDRKMLVIKEQDKLFEQKSAFIRRDFSADLDHFASKRSFKMPAVKSESLGFKKREFPLASEKSFVLFGRPTPKQKVRMAPKNQIPSPPDKSAFHPVTPPEAEVLLDIGKRFAIRKLQQSKCWEANIVGTNITHDAFLRFFYVEEVSEINENQRHRKRKDEFDKEIMKKYLGHIAFSVAKELRSCQYEWCTRSEKHLGRKNK